MSWLFSRALVEEYSAERCSDGELCAQLNVMPTPHKFWHNDKTMDAFSHSQFGLTCAVLTESRGEELLTSFRAAFRAKTSAQLDAVSESPEAGLVYGARWPGSLARYDRDSSSWKIAQCSLLEDSEQSLVTWPRWGLMLDGECWELPMLARPICENASGYWPTPTTMTRTGGAALCKWGGSGARAKLKKLVSSKELNGPLNPAWVSWLMGWQTEWTSLQPLATDKFREWQQQHGISSTPTIMSADR